MDLNHSNVLSPNVSKLNANATSFLKGTKDITLICVHGFTGASKDFSAITKYLNKVFNINCISISLPGHTGQVNDLKSIHYLDWVNSVNGAIKQCQKDNQEIHIMGLSMGASLSMVAAADRKNDIKSMTLFAPAIWTQSGLNDFLLYCLSKLPRWIIPTIEIQKEKNSNEELLFDAYPLQSSIEYKKVTLLAKKSVAKIQCPSMIIYSKDDEVIASESSLYIYKHLKHINKNMVKLTQAGHIVTKASGDEQKKIFDSLHSFYKKLF